MDLPEKRLSLEDLISNLATKVNKFVAQGQGEPAKTQGLIKMEGEESGPKDDAVLTQPSDTSEVAAASEEFSLPERKVTCPGDCVFPAVRREESPVPRNFQQMLDEVTQLRRELAAPPVAVVCSGQDEASEPMAMEKKIGSPQEVCQHIRTVEGNAKRMTEEEIREPAQGQVCQLLGAERTEAKMARPGKKMGLPHRCVDQLLTVEKDGMEIDPRDGPNESHPSPDRQLYNHPVKMEVLDDQWQEVQDSGDGPHVSMAEVHLTGRHKVPDEGPCPVTQSTARSEHNGRSTDAIQRMDFSKEQAERQVPNLLAEKKVGPSQGYRLPLEFNSGYSLVISVGADHVTLQKQDSKLCMSQPMSGSYNQPISCQLEELSQKTGNTSPEPTQPLDTTQVVTSNKDQQDLVTDLMVNDGAVNLSQLTAADSGPNVKLISASEAMESNSEDWEAKRVCDPPSGEAHPVDKTVEDLAKVPGLPVSPLGPSDELLLVLAIGHMRSDQEVPALPLTRNMAVSDVMMMDRSEAPPMSGVQVVGGTHHSHEVEDNGKDGASEEVRSIERRGACPIGELQAVEEQSVAVPLRSEVTATTSCSPEPCEHQVEHPRIYHPTKSRTMMPAIVNEDPRTYATEGHGVASRSPFDKEEPAITTGWDNLEVGDRDEFGDTPSGEELSADFEKVLYHVNPVKVSIAKDDEHWAVVDYRVLTRDPSDDSKMTQATGVWRLQNYADLMEAAASGITESSVDFETETLVRATFAAYRIPYDATLRFHQSTGLLREQYGVANWTTRAKLWSVNPHIMTQACREVKKEAIISVYNLKPEDAGKDGQSRCFVTRPPSGRTQIDTRAIQPQRTNPASSPRYAVDSIFQDYCVPAWPGHSGTSPAGIIGACKQVGSTQLRFRCLWLSPPSRRMATSLETVTTSTSIESCMADIALFLTGCHLEHLATQTSSQLGKMFLQLDTPDNPDQLVQMAHLNIQPNPSGLQPTQRQHQYMRQKRVQLIPAAGLIEELGTERPQPYSGHSLGLSPCHIQSLWHCGLQKRCFRPHKLYPLNKRSVAKEDVRSCRGCGRQQPAIRRAHHSEPDHPGLRGDLH